MMSYKIIFDEVILKQLKKAGKDQLLKNILSKSFNKIEKLGPRAGDLIDSQLKIYEIKIKRPPIRLFYKHNVLTNEIYVFEYAVKTSQEKQQSVIEKIKSKLKS
jgi:mRNA-degrading endonuclease RelE of RelBE toxin-antitoxin system